MDSSKHRMVTSITACRVCQSSRLEPILNFGDMPLANRYLTNPTETELRAPLEVVLCMDCGCVQLRHTVDPKILFDEYLYTSSTSGSLAEHFKLYAQDTVEKLSLKAGEDFIVGIGGNDGPLERAYQDLGFKVLNVEASANIAALSVANGVPTLNEWFDEKTARAIYLAHGQASLITCNNCFAHMPDIHGVVRAIKVLLKPGGWFVCENAYWSDTVRGNHFDQIYHEHCFYWTVKALDRLFRHHDLAIEDVEFNSSQGGSIRVFVQHDHVHATSGCLWSRHELCLQRSLPGIIQNEEAAGLFDLSTYIELNERIADWQAACQSFLEPLESICCYGVPAKFTMVSEQLKFTPADPFEGVDATKILYAVEDSPIKVGRYTPGSHIPIVAQEYFIEHPTKHCIITATNYADRIIAANPQYKGTWLVLIAEPRVITP